MALNCISCALHSWVDFLILCAVSVTWGDKRRAIVAKWRHTGKRSRGSRAGHSLSLHQSSLASAARSELRCEAKT